MISLKDNRLTTKKHGVVYCEEYVKEAVLEFQNVLKRALADNCNTITTEDTLDVFQDIFGDFEK